VVGEQVLLTTRAVGRGRISGIAVDQRFTIRYRFRAGLIASGKTYRDHAMALRDARRR
jgi:ketosteroid isomerase-like protein